MRIITAVRWRAPRRLPSRRNAEPRTQSSTSQTVTLSGCVTPGGAMPRSVHAGEPDARERGRDDAGTPTRYRTAGATALPPTRRSWPAANRCGSASSGPYRRLGHTTDLRLDGHERIVSTGATGMRAVPVRPGGDWRPQVRGRLGRRRPESASAAVSAIPPRQRRPAAIVERHDLTVVLSPPASACRSSAALRPSGTRRRPAGAARAAGRPGATVLAAPDRRLGVKPSAQDFRLLTSTVATAPCPPK